MTGAELRRHLADEHGRRPADDAPTDALERAHWCEHVVYVSGHAADEPSPAHPADNTQEEATA